MVNEALESVWMRVRDELRRQRGKNRFRGTEIHLLPKRQVRIPVEFRESKLRGSEITIHLSEVEAELWAIQAPEGRKWHIKDFSYNLSAFVGAVLEAAREGGYLHTNSKLATYRKEMKGEKE